MTIKIRQATPKDIPQIGKLYLEYQKEERKLADIDGGRWMLPGKVVLKNLKKYISNQNKIISIVLDENKVTGFIMGSFSRNNDYTLPDYGTIDEIYIIPKMRGKGLSSRLKDEYIEWFKNKKKGKGAIALYVMPRNEIARKAYKKWGFTVSDLKLVKEFK